MKPAFEPGSAGLYIHWPFCAALCPYCDFAVFVRKTPPFEAYADALETALSAVQGDCGPWRTIYFGGGTPSLVPNHILARFSETIDAGHAQEWTLEANPDDVNVPNLRAWRQMGVTRLSMGVQSFDDDYLAQLGRKHSGSSARASVELALSVGFEVSIDLIFNGPTFVLSTFQSDVGLAAQMGVHHVSSYELTVEPNTMFAKRASTGALGLADDVQMESDYRSTLQILETFGFERYEVSSFARDASYSLHNSGYWYGQPYEGIGVGAHGLRQVGSEWLRTANGRDLRSFLALDGEFTVESVSANEHILELAFLGMRTRFGFALKTNERVGADSVLLSRLESALERCVGFGWATQSDDRFIPTKLGLLVADDLSSEIWSLLDPT